jgi:Rrf2 family iron-sulfur cluster assembly transcriptional regulator
MKLGRDLEIAVETVSYLKDKENPVTVVEISRKLNVSFHFLQQITRKLRLAGLVNVRRGRGGGLILNKDSGSVTTYAVARALNKLTEGLDAGDLSSLNKLRQSIVDAYTNTVI